MPAPVNYASVAIPPAIPDFFSASLSDKAHDPLLRGAWYIEAGFGLLDGRRGLFASFDEAIASIERDLS